MVAPISSPATWKFHIIQLGVVYQKKRSPAPISECSASGFEVFEQHAAVPVHDALGQAGGAGGEQDPQRMVEIDLLGGQFGAARSATESQSSTSGTAIPSCDTTTVARTVGARPARRDIAGLVMRLSRRTGIRPRYQDDRFQLPETIQCRLGRIVLAAGTPHRTEGAVPRKAITASAIFGRYPITRSPGRTPAHAGSPRTRRCRPSSSDQEISVSPPFSSAYTMAGRSVRACRAIRST